MQSCNPNLEGMALLDETDEKEKRPTQEIDGRVRAQKTYVKGKKGSRSWKTSWRSKKESFNQRREGEEKAAGPGHITHGEKKRREPWKAAKFER